MELSVRQQIEGLRQLHREQEYIQSLSKPMEAPPREVTLFSFALPFGLAGLKDTLDLVFAFIPGMSFITALCFGPFIFITLMFSKTDKVLWDMRFLIRMGLLLIVGSLIDSFPIVAFFPIELLTVYIIYRMDKKVANTRIEEFLKFHREQIKWVVEKFGVVE